MHSVLVEIQLMMTKPKANIIALTSVGNGFSPLLRWFSALVFLLMATTVLANNIDHDETVLFWVEPGEQTKILSSKRINDAWQEPEQIYLSPHACASIAVATDSDGNSYLIWSEKRRNRTVLMLSSKSNSAPKWSEARVLSNFGKENNASTLVVDATDTLWLFWAANNGDLDDIYLRKKDASEWKERQRIHPANQVPDVRPVASLDSNGDVLVEWKQFDLKIGTYITQSRRFKLDSKPFSSYKTVPNGDELELIGVEQFDLSGAFSGRVVSPVLHLPQNRYQQTVKIEPNLGQELDRE